MLKRATGRTGPSPSTTEPSPPRLVGQTATAKGGTRHDYHIERQRSTELCDWVARCIIALGEGLAHEGVGTS